LKPFEQARRFGGIVRRQEPLAYQLATQLRRVAPDGGEHDALDVRQLRGGEGLDAAEVQERDAAVGGEAVVPGMRVAVEQAVTVEGAEDEAVDHLAPDLANVRRRLHGVAPRHAVDVLHGQGAAATQLGKDLRNANERVAAVEGEEALLVAQLDAVVEL